MSIPSSLTPLFNSGSSGAGGLQIERSLRFNSSDSAYCDRTPGTAGNQKTWTLSFWMKLTGRDGGSQQNQIFGAASGVGDTTFYRLHIEESNGGTINAGTGGGVTQLTSTNLLRDYSAWYHIVVAFDTTQSTAGLRHRLYINGTEATYATNIAPSFNTAYSVNSTATHWLGFSNISGRYFNGYLANIHFIDGQALTPSSFTETDATTGQLIPKTYTGSYGTNGFNLLFADNSSNTASTLGKDSSPNGNNWTPNNLSVGFPVTQNYSTTTSGTPPSPFNSALYLEAFDGNLSTAFFWTPGTWAMTWTSLPSAVTVSSTLRVYCYPRLGTLTVNINGSNVASITGATVDWRTISFTGTINTISFTGTDVYVGVYAIEVDGAILIDPRANSVNDSLVDSPTNYGTDTGVGGEVKGNYCTLNPLDQRSATLTNGNLDVSVAASSTGVNPYASGTIASATGKWYFEATYTSNTSNAAFVGVTRGADFYTYLGFTGVGYYGFNGQKVVDGTYTNYGNSFTTGDVIGVALDLDSGTVAFYKNNTSQGSIALPSSSSGWKACIGNGTSSGAQVFTLNFGQRAFAYTAPSGYKALCTQNLPTPLVAKPSTVFDVITYTGTGSSLTLPNGSSTPTSIAFTPDFAWLKGRSGATDHALYDAVRGVQKDLVSNSTSAETTETTGLTAFGTNTLTVGSLAKLNTSSATYVAWAWNAGGSTVSNTQGSITSQVRANATAGFSVVSVPGYTYPTKTAGHGLGVEPHFIITKSRGVSNPWIIYHKSAGANIYFQFDTGAGYTGVAGVWSGVTSTVFPLNSGVNQQTDIVAYCFAPVVGYSNGFSYTGNGSADGSFVYLGFRPKLLLIKRTDSTGNWVLVDSVRGAYNLDGTYLYANTSDAEATQASGWDLLSNGFKNRNTYNDSNTSSATYVGFAWAESPFNYSRAR